MRDRFICKVNIFYKNPEQKPVWKFIAKDQFLKEEKLSEEDFSILCEKSQIYFVDTMGECTKELERLTREVSTLLIDIEDQLSKCLYGKPRRLLLYMQEKLKGILNKQ